MKDILITPIITEKMTLQGEKFRRYGFIVNKKANKIEIKKAVEEMYKGITVKSVNTMVNPAKVKSRFTKTGVTRGRTSSLKKAIVTLSEGDEIDFYSNI